eukprot:3933992-Rhodomonas_salina.4
MEGTETVQNHRHITRINPEDITEEDKTSRKFKYNGKTFRVLNFISDSYKVDIEKGKTLYKCKKQDKQMHTVRAHFKLTGKNKTKPCSEACACVCCKFEWRFAEDPDCDCA